MTMEPNDNNPEQLQDSNAADQDGFRPTVPLTELQQAVAKLRGEVQKVIVGQDQVVDLLLIALLCDGHVLIEGAPGLAKTLTAKLLARCIKTNFSRIQFTPDLMPSDVIGTSVFDPRTTAFEFRPGPIFSNIILVDEINRAPAKTQSALFEAMEERQVTSDGKTHLLGKPFMIVATQNPIEQEGTYRLPEAQLDRFFFKVNVDYPTVEEEFQIMIRAGQGRKMLSVDAVQPVIGPEELERARSLVQQIRCDEKLMRYIASIVDRTRHDGSLMLGASPRASLAILEGSRAQAAMDGRDFVTPEDIQRVTPHVLRHRIQLTPEREMEGLTPDQVITLLVKQIEVPR
ncbi:MAG: MoxR family ATPase [Flavobacteriales bacterium]|nr:MoxR family ATPase [Flavobacteriales bacterium]MBK6945480.1 MoxR family ATPase [Flavobacteriales bacterium]MBK7241593.1 MoxR family ATPase [Flavobacteriales bacterium]MBK7296421.1 MoxR family ATPase [Flavobacteriales bacterium]MBK9534966.1 MoxR family ATPase [Flavobacteriales bacterium]